MEKILNLSGIIHDDEISEAEEAFILYTDTSESADDVSAIVVYIQDNDCKTTNFYILLPPNIAWIW